MTAFTCFRDGEGNLCSPHVNRLAMRDRARFVCPKRYLLYNTSSARCPEDSQLKAVALRFGNRLVPAL